MATAVRPYAAKVSGSPIMVDYTKASGSLLSGDVVVTTGLPAVALVDIPAFTGGQTKDALAVYGGIYAIMADGAIGLGVDVYYDATNKKVTRTASGNSHFGITVAGPSGGLEGSGPAADGDTAYVFHCPKGSGVSNGEGSIGASTAAAGSTNADAGALPAGTAKTYPTTAADDTKGVIIDVADKVTGRLLYIGNGVANKILKVYGPSGATINGGSANAAFSSVSGKGVIIQCLSSTSNTWLAW
jgi:predicted RecA/RadA family phage recombinase